MPEEFVFRIRPLSLEEGFELACDGILPSPMRLSRLYDAVIYALHLGRDLRGELHLFDSAGRLAERYPLHPELPLSSAAQAAAAH
jgi:hypothetical protein